MGADMMTATRERRPPRAGSAAPVRRCIVSGDRMPQAGLLRFVVGPDGTLVPDIEGDLPGRGLWLTAQRELVEVARAKKLFARAARGPVEVPADLADRVERLLVRRCIQTLGLARRTGAVVCGFVTVRAWLRQNRVALLVSAADAAPDGRRKLAAVAADDMAVVRGLTAAELGAALGRDCVVHAAMARGRLTERFAADVARLAGFRRSPATSDGSVGGDAEVTETTVNGKGATA